MDFDVIVIGSGQAGVPLAARLARSGKSALLAERADLGGTCVNTGCTPTKTLVASARAAHVARSAARLGVRVEAVQVAFPAVVARKDAMVRSWQEGAARRIAAASPSLRLVRGHARLVAERAIEVDGERHRGALIVLNVGARPIEPPLSGLSGVPWLDNRRVMELRALPAHLVVVGGGYIGCEFAQLYRRLGAAVTIVEPGPHLLGHEDVEASEAIEGSSATRTSRSSSVRGSRRSRPRRTRSPSGSRLGACSRPRTFSSRPDAARIRTTSAATPPASSTSSPDVPAAAGRTASSRTRRTRTRRSRASASPSARRRRRASPTRSRACRSRTWRAPSRPTSGRACSGCSSTPRASVSSVRRSWAEAGELIHAFAALMQAGATARALVEMEAVHPSFAEGVQAVVMALPRYALS